MKLRISLVTYTDARHPRLRDVALTFDATATVGEAARGLVRGGAGNPKLLPFAVHRHAPITLRTTAPDGSSWILDASDTVAESGLRSGDRVEPVLESHPGSGRRVRPAVASLTVMNGTQRQVVFMTAGPAVTVGRDHSNRVELHDPGVSRRHAVLRPIGDELEIEDLGSANGTSLIDERGERQGASSPVFRIRGSALVEFGTVIVRIEVGPPAEAHVPLQSAIHHMQAPRVDPVFAPDPIDLPAPPDAPEPTRFPLIALIAPALMGGVLYLATGSTMSLVFVALSPLIMIGSWLDQRLTRRKTARRKEAEFRENLQDAARRLEVNVPLERSAREQETPAPAALAALPRTADLMLWSRRPEHRAFLELRLGAASLPSRLAVRLPQRGKISAEHWRELAALHDRFAVIDAVPLLERLDRCGSLGVAGDAPWAGAAARGLLLQMFALHSPADVICTAFADAAQASGEWSWLKWLPHVDSAYSPLGVAHLAADERSGVLLLAALESLIARRNGAAGSATVRSRASGDAADAEERLSPADGVPEHPAIVVLVLADGLVDRTRLVGLAEDGADVGVHVLWVAARLGDVPAACRTVVEATADTWRAHLVRQGRIAQLSSLDGIDEPVMHAFARALAPFIDAGARVLDESDLPHSIGLAQIVPSDILGSSSAIAQNWRDTDSLVSLWQPGAEREAGSLAAIVGQGEAGPVEIDLRTHGPHALVGGTTGSGKSEFLQTWILSLAAHHAPDRLTFLLVDYKGGAAFADCVDLPHTVGLVTDLDTHLVRRALTSLRAELRFREELLAEKAAKDLVALERRGDPETPPVLVIVVDEFAALVGEVPDFIDGVIDIAQRGRSLGLHLVLATQRPAGAITDNLRANTNLRVALRTADPADSVDVIAVPDAAAFSPDVPGRAAIKVGSGRLTHLQTAFLGIRADTGHREAIEVRDLGFGERAPWNLLPELRRTRQGGNRGPRNIETLAANIRAAARELDVETPRRPWVDQLPTELAYEALESIRRRRDHSAAHGASNPRPGGASLGLIDEPHLQRQSPYALDLAETGNLAVFGGAGAGKTTTLITFAIAAVGVDPAAQVYGVDCGGGRLRVLEQLPCTGAIVPGDERDRVVRVLRLVKSAIAERIAGAAPRVPLLLLIDGLAAFRDAHEHRGGADDPFADLVEIAASGRTAGVHVALTSERTNGMPASLAASFSERIALRLPADSDYAALGVPSDALRHAGPGRALRIGSNAEVQLALPGASSDTADTDAAIRECAQRLGEAGVPAPIAVPAIPEILPRSEIARDSSRRAPFGIDTVRLYPLFIPESGLLLVTGPAGSGRTTAVRALLETLEEEAENRAEPLDALLIAPRRSSLRERLAWSGIGDDADSRDALLERLARSLGGAARSTSALSLLPLGDTDAIGADPGATADQAAAESGATAPLATQSSPDAESPFPRPGHRGLVVVEDIGGFDGTGQESALGALLKRLRRSELTTIVEGENATLGASWELSSPLRGARWALALQPDASDSPVIFTPPFTHVQRADAPPGRGLLISDGRRIGVHVGLPDGR